jgi:hypothetical protein
VQHDSDMLGKLVKIYTKLHANPIMITLRDEESNHQGQIVSSFLTPQPLSENMRLHTATRYSAFFYANVESSF